MIGTSIARATLIVGAVLGAAIAAASLGARAANLPPRSPTFTKDVAPILFENCARCHHPGGSAPFSLLTYRDARSRASVIASVTASKYMPPWLPEPGYGDFADAQVLSPSQIRTRRLWADTGAAEGAAADLPVAPTFAQGWQLGVPDLVIQMPKPYTLRADGPDVFRNFVLTVPITTTRYVKAIEILPGKGSLIHHANVLIDRSHASRRRDEEDADVGFGGMDISIESETFEPDSHFLFWKPGSPPTVEPDDMTWRLDPGDDLVLNMHMQPSGKPEIIQASIGLTFADKPPSRIPMLLQLEHDGAIDIPPGASQFEVSDDLTLPVDVNVLAVYPHAHYLGKDLKGYATLPNGTKVWLIWIKKWDLNWQAVFRFTRPVFLPQGTVVSMRYSYDNSEANPRNPSRPPRRVVTGNNATDEMGHLWLQVLPTSILPTSKDDQRVVLQEALMRRRLEKYPSDYTAHFNLASVLQSAGKLDDAVVNYRAAISANASSAAAQNGLATALQQMGRTDDAIVAYGRAIELDPTYTDAHYNLGNLLLVQNRPAEAQPHLQAVVDALPNDAKALSALGTALLMQGDGARARTAFEAAIRIDPDNADAHTNLAYVYSESGQLAEAAAQYAEVIRITPDDPEAHNELGILLAKQGKIAAAAAQFSEALRIDPSNSAARENLRLVTETPKQ